MKYWTSEHIAVPSHLQEARVRANPYISLEQETLVLIAVYGASGYQAGLVLAEMSRRNIDAVLVGRNAERLRTAATAGGRTENDYRVATLTDHAALVTAFTGCDAVINCAGPFTDSGQAVVRAAVAAGCHYVDTAGEQRHVATIFDAFAEAAEVAGVTVVPATNDGCLPVDLVAHLIGREADQLAEITTTHFLTGGGGESRGSLRSALRSMDVIAAGGVTYDDGKWHDGLPARRDSILLPGDEEPTPVAKFPFGEVVTIPRHVSVGYVESFLDGALSLRLGEPISLDLIESLPEGPSEEQRRTGRFRYFVDAVTTDGHQIGGSIQGTDTYGLTAVITVEATRRLVTDGAAPGVLAPAQAFEAADFLNFLVAYDVDWAIPAASHARRSPKPTAR
jgi:short subunit dehydrogenase-like uncharacterized protein